MIKGWIVADDLTGANVTGALLTKQGYKYGTFLTSDNIQDDILDGLDVIALSSESRGLNSESAYQRVYQLFEKSKEYPEIFLSKRIDSTLRGNIGAELDALLDFMGKESIILFCGAYPDVGKIVIGGYLLINRVPLENTGVSRDPKFPVHDSKVEKILTAQSRYPVASIGWDTIRLGINAVMDRIKNLARKGFRIISFDSLTNKDLETIAAAANQSEIKLGISDPGPLTLAYLKTKSTQYHQQTKADKIFLCIGSVAEISIKEIEHLKNDAKVHFEKINSLNLIDKSKYQQEINRAIQALDRASKKFNFIGITTAEKTSDILDLKNLSEKEETSIETLSLRINQGMAEISSKFLAGKKSEIKGLYTSGGDITLSFMKKINAYGIMVVDEIEPFTMLGKILGGPYHMKLIVTKGGLAGDENSLVHAMGYLKEKIIQEGE